MTIRFSCRCGKKMKTSDDKIGKKILCSACGSPVVVPGANTVSIESVVAPATAASDTAGALLRGTAKQEEKRTRKTIAFDDPSLDSSSTYDATETAKYVARGFLLPVAGVLVLCLVIYGMVSWITTSKSKRPELADVTGSVYLDGKPLAGAQILFRPHAEGMQGAKAGPAAARTDEDGRHRLRYASDTFGAPVGVCIVTITAVDDRGMEVVPLRYRDRTEKRTVESGGNSFDFQLSSSQP